MVSAMIFFTYQVVERMLDYYDYETTVSVNVLYMDRVPLPTITLCNINTFRYSLINTDLKRVLMYWGHYRGNYDHQSSFFPPDFYVRQSTWWDRWCRNGDIFLAVNTISRIFPIFPSLLVTFSLIRNQMC